MVARTWFLSLGFVIGSAALVIAQPAANKPPAAGSSSSGRTGAPPAAGAQTGQGTGTATTIAPAAADAAATTAAWSTGCSSDGRSAALDCSVEQRAVVTNTGQLVTLVRVRVPADTKKPVMMVQVPLGLFLPAGVTVDVDGNNIQKLGVQTCDTTGCYAGSPISPEVLTAMFGGQKLNVSFQPLNKQPVKIPMELNGFRAAFIKIN